MSSCTRWVDRGVIECKQWASRLTAYCTEWAEERRRECAEEEDRGRLACDRYQTVWEQRCDDWDSNCCDWWPCSWGCELITWLCVGWTWISSQICIAWVWIKNIVCVAWTWIVQAVCVAVAWIVTAFCVVWSWVAKLVCIAWGTWRCLVAVLVRGVRTFWRRRGGVPQVRHVFVLMLENRSLDHMLGDLEITGIDSRTGQVTRVDNLFGNPQQNIDPGTGSPVPAGPPADFSLSAAAGDPGHEFSDTVTQLAGADAEYPFSSTQQYPPINNSGFVANYRARGSTSPEKAMHCYELRQLPVLNALAREFAVCDHWYSSMPGPTWPNRLFVHAASSAGLDDSPGPWDTVTTTLIDGFRFDNGTLYDRLEDRCLNWLIFEGDETPQVFSLSGMNFAALQGRFRDFEDFRSSVNDPLYPASYAFIEPDYGNILPGTPEDFTCGTSQHPLDDVTRGERLIKDVYEAVRASPLWNSSLIIVTWDEHGGFFDHCPPPRAVHPGDSITDDDNNHNDFDFTQLGVRVPAVIISPFIPRGTIDHTDYDHSSVVKTVGEIFGFGPLTERDAAAESFRYLLSLSTPRNDTPVTLAEPANSGLTCVTTFPFIAAVTGERGMMTPKDRSDVRDRRREPEEGDKPIEPTMRGFLHAAMQRHMAMASLRERDRIPERVTRIRTNAEAKAYIAEVRQLVRAYKTLHPQRKPWLRPSKKGPDTAR